MAADPKDFDDALAFVEGSSGDSGMKLNNNQKLVFYGLFKQIEKGPCTDAGGPSRLKVIERMKWKAWRDLGKMSKDEAKKQYVQELAKLVPDWKKKAAAAGAAGKKPVKAKL